MRSSTAVPTALDFPDCLSCQMWQAAGASWPRPCKEHYGGEPTPQVRLDCCNPECSRPGNVYVGDLTDLGDWACTVCEVYIVGDGNDD